MTALDTNVRSLVDRCLEKILGDGLQASEAADAVLNGPLDGEVEAFLRRYGLVSLLNNTLHYMRGGRSGNEARPEAFARYALRSPHGKQWAPYMVALSIAHVTKAGVTRPLLDFDGDDWRHLANTFRVNANGLLGKAKVAESAVKLLVRFSARTARQLPVEAQRELGEAVNKAWT